jgi:predicted transcriptional regulator
MHKDHERRYLHSHNEVRRENMTVSTKNLWGSPALDRAYEFPRPSIQKPAEFAPVQLSSANFRLPAVEMTHQAVLEYAKTGATGDEIMNAIPRIHAAYMQILTSGVIETKKEQEPAVPVKKSVTDDYIISLEDGKKYKTLKRHLAKSGMTPDEYRAKWGLPHDYPVVCKSYSERRSQLAKENGLGRK